MPGPGGGCRAQLGLSCWTMRNDGGDWKSASIGGPNFQSFPLPKGGFLFPQPPTALAKLSTLLGATKCKPP